MQTSGSAKDNEIHRLRGIAPRCEIVREDFDFIVGQALLDYSSARVIEVDDDDASLHPRLRTIPSLLSLLGQMASATAAAVRRVTAQTLGPCLDFKCGITGRHGALPGATARDTALPREVDNILKSM